MNSNERPKAERERITSGEDQLFRPIIEVWVPDGEVTPAAFMLSTADKEDSNRLSIAREGATDPEGAYNERAGAIKKRCESNGREFRPPVGVLAVTVSEVESVEVREPEHLGPRRPLAAWDDSMNESIPDDHGHIDYNDLPPTEKGLHRYAAKALLNHAVSRGWVFKPGD